MAMASPSSLTPLDSSLVPPCHTERRRYLDFMPKINQAPLQVKQCGSRSWGHLDFFLVLCTSENSFLVFLRLGLNTDH